jgi:hypothetical protein
MERCNSVSMPQLLGLHLKPFEKDDSGSYISIEDHDKYRSLVGSLLYASAPCWPDLAYAARALAQFMYTPGSEHWSAAKHCLRYIQRTKDYKLIFGPNKDSTDLRIEVCTNTDLEATALPVNPLLDTSACSTEEQLRGNPSSKRQ